MSSARRRSAQSQSSSPCQVVSSFCLTHAIESVRSIFLLVRANQEYLAKSSPSDQTRETEISTIFKRETW